MKRLLFLLTALLSISDVLSREIGLQESVGLDTMETMTDVADDMNDASSGRLKRSDHEAIMFNYPNLLTRTLIDEDGEVDEFEDNLEGLDDLMDDDLEEVLRELQLMTRQKNNNKKFNYCTYNEEITCDPEAKYRTINGMCNNLVNQHWGMALAQHKRRIEAEYNGRSQWDPRSVSAADNATPLPNERLISNSLHSVRGDSEEDETGISMAVFAWGQFLDHDLAATPFGKIKKNKEDCCGGSNDRFCLTIDIPEGDPYFTNRRCMNVTRSAFVNGCRDTGFRRFKNQFNQVTSFLDGSNVYGSSDEEAMELRTKIGGELKVEQNFPPNDPEPHECRAKSPDPCLQCGDGRCNVVPTLASLHALFVREHNRVARHFAVQNPRLDDETLYQEARRFVIAVMQMITYDHFLPLLLPPSIMTDKELNILSNGYSTNYNVSLDPTVANSFMIAWRIGHSWIPSFIQHLNADFVSVASKHTDVTYLTPHELFVPNYQGFEGIARFTAHAKCPKSDALIEDAARNRLFESESGKQDGFDLMALNIKREREWGTPGYVKFREFCGVGEVNDWNDLENTHDQQTISSLKKVYVGSVLDIDLLPGLMTETHEENSVFGPTLNCLIGETFRELKLGDRFWFENQDAGFSDAQLEIIRKMTLSKVMCLNLNIEMIARDAFVTEDNPVRVSCTELTKDIDLSVWNQE